VAAWAAATHCSPGSATRGPGGVRWRPAAGSVRLTGRTAAATRTAPGRCPR